MNIKDNYSWWVRRLFIKRKIIWFAISRVSYWKYMFRFL